MTDTQTHNGEATTATLRLPPSQRSQPPFLPPEPPKSSRTRIALIIAGSAITLVALVVLAVILLNDPKSSSVNPDQVYQQKLTDTLTPVVAANRALSVSLQALDGSKTTIFAVQNATTQARQTVTAASGAVAVLSVPKGSTQLSQQTAQALTQESGYLQAVTTTLGNPTGNTAASLQPLASSTSSAFVPLTSIAPGGSRSLYGVDNLLNWVAGAAAAAKRQETANAKRTVVVVVPSGQTITVNPSNVSSGLYSIDSNISATPGISASLASNVFYDYWSNGGAGSESYSSWSPASQQYYNVSASSDGYTVTAYVSGTTDPSARVVFSQHAINDYTQADAKRFLASGNHGNADTGGQSAPDGGGVTGTTGTPGTVAIVHNPNPALHYTYDSTGHLIAVNSSGVTVYSDNQASSLPGVPDNPNP